MTAKDRKIRQRNRSKKKWKKEDTKRWKHKRKQGKEGRERWFKE
jgi:hypothetical protein